MWSWSTALLVVAHAAPALAGLGGSVVIHDPSSHLHHTAGAAGAVRLSELGDLLASVLGVRSAAPRAAALPAADLLHRPATNLLVTVDGFPSDVDGALARAPRESPSGPLRKA